MRNDDIGRWATGDERGVDTAVESGELGAVFHGQGEEIQIRQLRGRRESRILEGIGQRKVVLPEVMPGRSQQAAEQASSLVGRTRPAVIAGIAENPEEGIFREWARCPTVFQVIEEPLGRTVVEEMIVIE